MVQFSAVKFTGGNEEKYELSSDTKISESLKKKSEQSGRVALIVQFYSTYYLQVPYGMEHLFSTFLLPHVANSTNEQRLCRIIRMY